MADRYDVAARLAEGEPAVDDLQSYVRACQALGYQQPDLTAHPSQLGDWYDTESGLDLQVLNGDVTELGAAVTAVEEALWIQRTQLSELAAAWRGSGAESATQFLQRHCDAAQEVVAQLHTAAEECATLRDDLWRAVDGKVASTVAVDDRSTAHRSTWLVAAHTVGSPDADAIIHKQVMPFVDNDIRNDWLAAMSAANASVAGSYDTAIHALASTRDARFDIPGDLGPRWQPSSEESPVAASAPMPPLPASPQPTSPAAAPVSPQTADVVGRVADEPEAAPTEPETPLDDADGLSSGTGGLGGLGGMTGGVGGVVESIVDGIGSLLGSLTSGLGGGTEDDPLGADDDDPLGADDDDPVLDDADEPDKPAGAGAPAVPADAVAPTPPVGENPGPAAEVAAQPVDPPPEAAPPVEQPAPAAAPTVTGSTPCEIAEDQLPQAGQ